MRFWQVNLVKEPPDFELGALGPYRSPGRLGAHRPLPPCRWGMWGRLGRGLVLLPVVLRAAESAEPMWANSGKYVAS